MDQAIPTSHGCRFLIHSLFGSGCSLASRIRRSCPHLVVSDNLCSRLTNGPCQCPHLGRGGRVEADDATGQAVDAIADVVGDVGDKVQSDEPDQKILRHSLSPTSLAFGSGCPSAVSLVPGPRTATAPSVPTSPAGAALSAPRHHLDAFRPDRLS